MQAQASRNVIEPGVGVYADGCCEIMKFICRVYDMVSCHYARSGLSLHSQARLAALRPCSDRIESSCVEIKCTPFKGFFVTVQLSHTSLNDFMLETILGSSSRSICSPLAFQAQCSVSPSRSVLARASDEEERE